MKITILFFVVLLFCFSGIASASLTDGLVAYYPFNGNANDASGNGNNGTVKGATLTSDRFGSVNSAYYFDGVNDFIEVPNSNSLNITQNQLTISYWINWQNSTTYCNYFGISKGGYDVHAGYELYVRGSCPGETENGFMGMSIGNSSSGALSVTNANSYRNTWVHLVGVLDNKTVTLYINGQKATSYYENTTSVPMNPGSSSAYALLIGTRTPGNANVGWLSGTMDDIRIYNRALSDSEIQQLYTGSTCSQSDYNAAYQQGYNDAVKSLTSAGTTQCASYDFFTATIHMPCFNLYGTNYWLDMGTYSSDPLLFELTNYGLK